MKSFVVVLAALATLLSAQTTGARTVIGSITAFRASSGEIEVKQDNGIALPLKVGPITVVQKVAPGQADLTKAQTIQITDLSLGDRVLVTFDSTEPEARRVVVVSVNDLEKHNAEDRLDWTRRGVAGVVTAITGNEIALEARSLGGVAKSTVTVGDKTSFRRYAPDSVKYADAKASKLQEVTVGDQMRARGQKTPDGTKVTADEVVFGTFLSRAGTITAVNPQAGEVTIKDLANNKPMVVKFIMDSQVKRMPEAASAPPAAGGAARATPPPPAAAASKGPVPAGAPSGVSARPPDLGQMLDALPQVKIEDLKPGEVIVVSAIKGARADQITAVTFLANAERLVQLAMQARGAGATGPAPSLASLAGSISAVGP